MKFTKTGWLSLGLLLLLPLAGDLVTNMFLVDKGRFEMSSNLLIAYLFALPLLAIYLFIYFIWTVIANRIKNHIGNRFFLNKKQ